MGAQPFSPNPTPFGENKPTFRFASLFLNPGYVPKISSPNCFEFLKKILVKVLVAGSWQIIERKIEDTKIFSTTII